MAYEDFRCPIELNDDPEYQCTKNKGHMTDGDEWHEDKYKNKWNKDKIIPVQVIEKGLEPNV